MKVILAGGPKHGAIYEVSTGRELVFAVNFPVGQLFVPGDPVRPPKPNWKKYIFRYYEWAKAYDKWKYWKPVTPEYSEPVFEQIVYRLKWRNPGTNEAIYWYEGAVTAPFDTANEIFHYLWDRIQEARHAHPVLDDRYHWEMGRDWFGAIWNAVIESRYSTMVMERRETDMLAGFPVEVTGPRGAPRIVENEKVEAIR